MRSRLSSVPGRGSSPSPMVRRRRRLGSDPPTLHSGRCKVILGLAPISKFLPAKRAALTTGPGQFWTTPRKPPSRTRGWNSASLDAPHTRPICPCLSRYHVCGAVSWLRAPCYAASQPSSRRSWPLATVALSSLTAMPLPRTRRLSMPRMQRGGALPGTRRALARCSQMQLRRGGRCAQTASRVALGAAMWANMARLF